MDKRKLVISVLLGVLVILILIIIYYKVVRAITVSSTIYIPPPSSTTCNISCPPGYEVDPLSCTCSPLVPTMIQVQPNPLFNIRLWLAIGTSCLGTACSTVLKSPNNCLCLGKACLGFHPEWSSCCPPAPNIPCQYCDQKYGCNPPTAQTEGVLTFTGKVLSSNGTPIPNTQVNVQSPFPKTYTLQLNFSSSIGPIYFGTITLTLYPPPSTVTTDDTGTFTVAVPFKAVLTDLSPNAFANPLMCIIGGQASLTFNIGPSFEFNLSIPDSAISIPVAVGYNLSVCVNQQSNSPVC